MYRDADIYLLDDPLSAVDTHVGQHLFDECMRGILRQKTVILVTHQLQYLKGADLILLIQNVSFYVLFSSFSNLKHCFLLFYF